MSLMLCPACGTIDGEPSFELAGFPILGCDTCGHEFVGRMFDRRHVAETYGDSYFEDGGSGYPGYLRMGEMLRKRGRFYAKKVAPWARAGRVLDIGCGAGFLLAGFEDRGWKGSGLEPNARVAEYGRKELGLNVVEGAIEVAEVEGQFDLVMLVQVVGHLYDPERSWEKIFKLVKPGGHVLVETWDRESITARMLKHLWHEYDAPTVLNWFSRRSLEALAERHGFREVASRRTLKYITLGHAASALAHKVRRPMIAHRAFQAMRGAPSWMCLPYLGDDLFWSLFRKPTS